MFKNINIENFALCFVVIFTVLIILSGSYLPMVDLPQHASQVATLNDVIKGQSRWQHLFELNFATPYLLGYTVWLILHQIFDIVVASRILVALIFTLFVFSFYKIREAFQSSILVPWIAIPTFFGFSYEWGFVTFLLSISVGLLFFLLNIKYSKTKKNKYLLLLTIVGLLLFFSHILSFLFFCLLSFCYLAINIKKVKEVLTILPSYVFFFGLLVFYILQKDSLSEHYSYGAQVMYHSLGEKVYNLMVLPWGMSDNLYVYISIFFLIFPFIFGCDLSKDKTRYIPLMVFLLVWLSLPHFINNTYFIYQRYSILFFGFYYLIFDDVRQFKYKSYLFFVWICSIVYTLSADYKSILLAKKETEDFKQVIQKVPEHKRVLALVFEPTSNLIEIPFTFLHFGSWYQAQKGGWSDFNFAWFHPQIVRYKPEAVPEVKPGFEWSPYAVQGLKTCQNYELLLVRAYDGSVQNIVENSLCGDYHLLLNEGNWFVFAKNVNE